ncbi:YfcC family protein [Spirochaeta cellobiosiphila]|uniref:YfcC family protein n=1 Tax=Spirochaeta cellobiosiphila TaxID=504483 RepID=UPI00040D2161|nr:Na+/H+ antiporter NhaC family protein [Spirochaeta cellobiosiphila]
MKPEKDSMELKDSSLKVGVRSFLMALGILLVLMIASGVMTKVLPAGQYDRTVEGSRTLIITGSYHPIPQPEYPFWRWFTAPVEILFNSGAVTLYTIILFLLFVGGSITILERIHVMDVLMDSLIKRFKDRKYLLMGIMIFVLMLLPSFLGVYEGLVPLIIFIVPMAKRLGWDSLTGLGMSLLPMAFGMASGVTNPFTVGVAQTIADLPLFSGAWLRLIFFVITYGFVYAFVAFYARKVEKDRNKSLSYQEDHFDTIDVDTELSDKGIYSPKLYKSLSWFLVCISMAFAVIVGTGFIPQYSFLAFPLMGLMFVIGGIGAGLIAGYSLLKVGQIFLKGWQSMVPGVILILLAYSVKYIIDQGGITDTILYRSATAIKGAPPSLSALLVYVMTLGMNFFIGSASAKAFLMMPILVPLADLVGITRQTAVLAFGFGDGFSNMLFPTNPLLLIALSLTVISYPKWFRWTLILQAFMAGLSILFLFIATSIGFGPF